MPEAVSNGKTASTMNFKGVFRVVRSNFATAFGTSKRFLSMILGRIRLQS